MRRHLNLSLESLAPGLGQTVSLEEEQIMTSDAADLAAEIHQELNECDRNLEISDALEDLAIIADQIEQASPVEIALIEKVGDMAVAGTDIEAEQVVPSMESFKGKRIAVEGFKDTAATIWKNIQAFLKSIWDKIEKFFYNIFGVIPNVQKRLDQLEEKIQAAQNRTPRGTVFEVSTGGANGSIVNRLSINGQLFRNDNELKAEVMRLHEHTIFCYGPNIAIKNILGKEIASVIEAFDPAGDLDAQAMRIVHAYHSFYKKSSLPGSAKKSTSGMYELINGETMFGGASLIGKVYQQNEPSILGTLERLRHSNIQFENGKDRAGHQSGGSTNMPIVSLTTMSLVVKQMKQMLTLLEEYKRGPHSKAVASTRKQLEAASKKAQATFGKGDETSSNASVQYFRSMLNFNAAYARAVDDPAIPFARYLMNTISALMGYTNLCLATYKAA